jgi:peptide chain release factor 1
MADLDKLVEELERSYVETRERMSDPAVYNDHREAAEVGRRLKELEGPWKLAEAWKQARADLDAARNDSELSEMVADYQAEVARLEEELMLSLVEHDPADSKNVIVEIRGGEGGEEGKLWAGDLANMLQKYAERRGFKWEEIEVSPSETGGIKEGTYAIKGDGAFSIFKYEGGTHRVQRVPETESQGRIHTSTATIAVMPEAEDLDLEINESDLKIDVFRSSGPGGQSVNTTDRTSAPSSRTATRRCACCGRGCTSRSARSRRPRKRRHGLLRSAPARAPRRSAPTTSPRTASPTTASS